jgi:molybdopterin-containing oxidoreductase family iron-sulfur binding subunit
MSESQTTQPNDLRTDLPGERMWRSLNEYEGGERFEDQLKRAHPAQTQKVFDPPQRREFLKLMGASLALAGVSVSCTKQPEEKIVPWAKSPEQLVPGKPVYFATTMPWAAGSIGLLIESHMGRPTKSEGNPLHPSSLGASDIFAQGAVLGLYDPDRSKGMLFKGRATNWSMLVETLKNALGAQGPKQGAGLRILSQAITSPTLAAQRAELLAKFPMAAWCQWQPINRDNARAGAIAALGQDVRVAPRFADADVVVSLGADFLSSAPENVRLTRDFTARRKVRGGKAGTLNRLYAVEHEPTCTGGMADHRLTLRASEIEALSRALAAKLGVAVEGDTVSAATQKWVDALAADLKAHEGRSLVIAGEEQPAAVHAVTHLINAKLGNAGKTVQYLPPAEFDGVDNRESIGTLVREMREGKVDVLVILSGNPVYDAPVDLDFAAALAKVPLRVQLSQYDDETSNLCDWHIHETHFLEAWSDARCGDGTIGIVQPLIAPLYDGKSAHELINALLEKSGVSAYDTVRATAKARIGEADFEKKWRRAVHDGLFAGTAAAPLNVSAGSFGAPAAPRADGIEIVFRHDQHVHDGRFANNGWLQEQPRTMTKLTWDNVALISPAMASSMGVKNGAVVEIDVNGRKLKAPVWVQPGHADDSVTVQLGFGRSRCGKVADGIGYNAYSVRTSNTLCMGSGVKLAKTGEEHELATTQEHDSMTTNLPENRQFDMAPVRVATVERFEKNPKLVEHVSHYGDSSLYPEYRQGEYAWGMVIDLSSCTACGACITACSAENNIPVVGKKEVKRGREMHWLRVDRYFQGDPRNPAIHAQPIPCMQCENAPCETVCPVAATVHSPEGLNDMVYNRCIGTRYCANNCPYKVRRFNFFLYSDYETESLKMGRNPDVSVRSRGVMEKCTYCVQRINEARYAAKRESRRIREGEIRTACQSVCPADAIAFGDLKDPESAVSKLAAEPQNYALLAELNTRPRTTFLAKITNPNPELAS